jgi:hypothetical protein
MQKPIHENGWRFKQMKKFLFIITCIIISASKLFALDMTIGATAWYAQSENYYTQSGVSANSVLHDSLVKSDPAFLYGPTLSVKLTNEFNLTFVYLYGTFVTVIDDGSWKTKSTYQRSDSDLALNYRFSNYFKLFAGIKYFSYDITPAKTDLFNFMIKNIDTHTSYGLGFGVSGTYPLTDNLFCLGTLSGLYLLGADKLEITDIGAGSQQTLKNKYNEYGINSTLGLAYYIAPASTVISLGGRFQHLIADYKKNAIGLDSVKFTIYGVTLTATYTFGI